MDLFEARSALNGGKSIYDLALRVTFYARVSTEKEEQLHSLSAQTQYYTEFIAKCPAWTFVEGYVDEGISGTSADKREQFLRMIADAGEGKFDFIITKEISRFSRNTLDSIRYTQELLKYGVGVLFQSDNINTLMPDAELRLTIMSSIAQDEVRKISERVRFGFRRAIEAGVVLGNSKIWGYEKQDGKLVLREEEAEMVRLIFDLYANRRMGIRTIAAQLTERGYRNTKGGTLSFSTIRGILSNPKYKGYYCGGKSCKYDYKLSRRRQMPQSEWVMYKDEEAVPPIVSEELWDKANAILNRRTLSQGSRDRSSYQNKYPYSGKIICSQHQIPYHRTLYHYRTEDREAWQCREYARKGRAGCIMPVLYTEELDELIRQTLEQLPLDKEELLQGLLGIYGSFQAGGRQNRYITQSRHAMAEILRRKDRLLDLNVAGHISDEEFTQRNEAFNEELAQIRTRLEELECRLRQEQAKAIPEETLRPALKQELEFDQGFQRGVIEALVDRIEAWPGQAPRTVQVRLTLHISTERWTYLIQRRRGKPSVCTAQYT